MVVNAIRLSFLTCYLTLCQCASGPHLERKLELQPGDKVVATYLQPPTSSSGRSILKGHDPTANTALGEIRQALVTESVVSAAELYRRQTAQFTKVLSAENMQVLLDYWATSGFFEHATPTAIGRANSYLILEVNGVTSVWSKRASMSPEQHRGWQEAFGVFFGTFNRTTSYYSNSAAVGKIREEGDSQPRTNLKIGSRREKEKK